MNQLHYGDNLTLMQERMKNHSVDLIYLDPPFKSNQNYNLLYKTLTGKPVPEQAEAFCDTWEMDAEKQKIAQTMPVLMKEKGVEDYYVEFWRLWMNALRTTRPHLLAYLIYMVERLLYMKGILKPTGSIYLHCDPEASHYIKVMMDGIFGHKNFRNEIVWKRTYAHSGARRWGDVHDTLLFYTNSDTYTWNKGVKQAHGEGYVDEKYRWEDARGRYSQIVMTGPGTTQGASGQPWRGYDPTAAGRHWAVPQRALEVLREEGLQIPDGLHDQLDLLFDHGFIYIPKKKSGDGVPRFKYHLTGGQPIQDVIGDIPPINSQAKERLGYPTQKPITLLKRIIEVSSNKGDTVFDPFCGCGTTLYAAHEAQRRWIGCDIAILAIRLIREVLVSDRYRLVEGRHFTIDGIPVSVEQAKELFNKDPFQFQHWAVERVGGFPMQRKVADRGIDGRLYFETKKALEAMVISVKGGTIRPTDIRDLRGVLEREKDAKLAGFISLREPTKAMKAEAGEAGMYEYAGVSYPRIQLLTVPEILEGKRQFDTPGKVESRIATAQQNLPL